MRFKHGIVFRGNLTPARLKALRILTGVRREELSKRTAFTLRFIAAVEEGRKWLAPDNVYHWLRALHATANDPVLRYDPFETNMV